ncbi:uncharacterized protein LOC113306193 [Papaver somniferum]|uniref:uncharacterized protein LOC113306193 n=1 Tax=Papaver somniferum TaxID=3469 RepID=UPI000E6FC511|nr:uncharacterized protein LOC113306193 [Papaver somniferum]
MKLFCKLLRNWEIFGDLSTKLKQAEEKVLSAYLLSDSIPEDIQLLNNLVTARGEQDNEQGSLVATQQEISDVLVKHFEDKFKYSEVQMSDNLLQVVPEVLSNGDKFILDSVPSAEEIKVAVNELDPDSSPGPDGFSGWLYRKCWSIIGNDISSMLSKIISPQQGAFIKGKTIQEQIVLASEMVNGLDTPRRGGNVEMKIDITQGFDSIIWEFLFAVLHKLGFSANFIKWLHTLFSSARISVLING